MGDVLVGDFLAGDEVDERKGKGISFAARRWVFVRERVAGVVYWEIFVRVRVRSTLQGWSWWVGERRLRRRDWERIFAPGRIIVLYCTGMWSDGWRR